jgi:hypothetical protein
VTAHDKGAIALTAARSLSLLENERELDDPRHPIKLTSHMAVVWDASFLT